MNRLDGVIGELLETTPLSIAEVGPIFVQLMDMWAIMDAARLVHGDIHLHNVGYLRAGGGAIRLQLLDFGDARAGKSELDLELIQLAHTSHPDSRFMNPTSEDTARSARIFHERIVAWYRRVFEYVGESLYALEVEHSAVLHRRGLRFAGQSRER